MRIITANLNGIRSAAKKGFFEWMHAQNADVICIQETKAQEHQLDPDPFYPANYHCSYFDAVKKGYSGVAIYSRRKPDQVVVGLGFERCDNEGRYIQADFGALSVAFMEQITTELARLRRSGRDYIVCGDWNTVHREIDIRNFRSNQKNSGCTPPEREWIDDLFTQCGWVDAFRVVNQEPDQYTWWSNRGEAWAKNVGWRIDYQIATPKLGAAARAAEIYKTQRFSDHAPLIIDYDYDL
ncbi:MAG: exodeoxyribonuclease III [Gammaproteobacteria bacterium]|nr:exodeoxyribonuclease III [Gammaproteobacteria bacterium]